MGKAARKPEKITSGGPGEEMLREGEIIESKVYFFMQEGQKSRNASEIPF